MASLGTGGIKKRLPKQELFDAVSTPLVVVRTPVLPLAAILDVYEADDVFGKLLEVLRGSGIVRQAIRVASPSLANAVNEWCATGVPANANVPLRALAYFARMSSRPTPFGLCAGISEVEVGDHSTLAIDRNGRRTKTRVDMGLLTDLCRRIEKGEHRGGVHYVASDAIIKRGSRLYVTDVLLANPNGFTTDQRPVTLRDTASVQFVREFTLEQRSYDEIVRNLVSRFGATVDEAARHLDALIEAGVIISELRVSPVGNPSVTLLRRLGEIDTSLKDRLDDISERIYALDQTPLECRDDARYEQLADACRSLSPSDDTVQIDLSAPVSGTLSEDVVRDAATLCELYARMGTQYSLKKYRERFLRRYEGSERMVPLLELTDDNIGLGTPEDPEPRTGRPIERDLLVMQLACDALRTRATEIELNDSQLALIAPPLDPESSLAGYDIGFQIAAQSLDAIDRGEYLLFSDGYFASTKGAVRSVGRFMHLFDDGALDRARTLMSRNMDGVLRAELIYAPAKGRNYNISVRPRFLASEIQVGVVDSSANDVIRLDDLWVGLDQDKFFLWSASRRCRVVPVESHHFNTSRLAPNVCRFLSLVSEEGVQAVGPFPWGDAHKLTSLPRIRIGRIVISLRTWRFAASEFGSSASDAALALSRLRSAWVMPRYVTLVESDNRLLFDLESACAGTLLDDRRKAAATDLVFQEFLTPRGWLLDDNRAPYVGEFIAAVMPARMPQVAQGRTPVIVSERNRYGPGSHWLFAKIYLGSQAIEQFLLRSVLPLVEQYRAAGALDRWFFLRYSDPYSHLRVRLRFSKPGHALGAEFLRSIEPQLVDGTIERYVLDTYDPEYERYGGVEGVDAAERFFSADSDLCAELLRRAERSNGARAALAARSFAACLNERPELRELTLAAFADVARGKQLSEDRAAIKSTNTIDVPAALGQLLEAALVGGDHQQRLRSFFHVHCNRLGVTADVERRATMILRALVLKSHLKMNGKSSALDSSVLNELS